MELSLEFLDESLYPFFYPSYYAYELAESGLPFLDFLISGKLLGDLILSSILSYSSNP
jgi:hypothetical protein